MANIDAYVRQLTCPLLISTPPFIDEGADSWDEIRAYFPHARGFALVVGEDGAKAQVAGFSLPAFMAQLYNIHQLASIRAMLESTTITALMGLLALPTDPQKTKDTRALVLPTPATLDTPGGVASLPVSRLQFPARKASATKGRLLDEYKLVVIPIHGSLHWSLGILDIDSGTMFHFDSLHQNPQPDRRGSRVSEHLRHILQEAGYPELQDTTLTTVSVTKQPDGTSCGYIAAACLRTFVAAKAEHGSRLKQEFEAGRCRLDWTREPHHQPAATKEELELFLAWLQHQIATKLTGCDPPKAVFAGPQCHVIQAHNEREVSFGFRRKVTASVPSTPISQKPDATSLDKQTKPKPSTPVSQKPDATSLDKQTKPKPSTPISQKPDVMSLDKQTKPKPHIDFPWNRQSTHKNLPATPPPRVRTAGPPSTVSTHLPPSSTQSSKRSRIYLDDSPSITQYGRHPGIEPSLIPRKGSSSGSQQLEPIRPTKRQHVEDTEDKGHFIDLTDDDDDILGLWKGVKNDIYGRSSLEANQSSMPTTKKLATKKTVGKPSMTQDKKEPSGTSRNPYQFQEEDVI